MEACTGFHLHSQVMHQGVLDGRGERQHEGADAALGPHNRLQLQAVPKDELYLQEALQLSEGCSDYTPHPIAASALLQDLLDV